ncbi:MAG: hypothetical protein ACTIKA_03590 [Psychroflexus halocasei]|uniref:hypothetical protein n=1 Tax=Psychroflexus sp. S27 TaxID=1982757 RepID=UPI000C2A3230|nr:hypothetical protein [Psychroflexus sp. S27]PJX28394.1 hypothetical protein CAP47_00735 [Psychroflexus sp. S27]
MKFKPTNLQTALDKQRGKSVTQEELLSQVSSIFNEVDQRDQDVLERATSSNNNQSTNNFEIGALETNRVYHIDDIKKICISYRLRFLNSQLFKADLPYEAIQNIKDLEKTHETSLSGFKIMAPSKLFKLANADDPLLFAPIENGYYYLIHKWGNDLSPFRRIKMWPLINLENFIFTAFIISLLVTYLLPQGFFMNKEDAGLESFILFIFMFKWILGVALYYGFAKGKNFNSAIWTSRYYNA